MEDQPPYTPDPAQLERAFGFKKNRNDNKSANTLTKAVLRFAREKGAFGMRINTQGTYDPATGKFRTTNATKGVSDIIIVKEGRFIACEVKHGKDRLSDVQKEFREKVSAAGGKYIVVSDIETFKAAWDII